MIPFAARAGVVDTNWTPRPTLFYLSAKSGWSPSHHGFGGGFNFRDQSMLYSASAGIDFNMAPPIRLELEVATAPKSALRFDDPFLRAALNGSFEYQSLILNTIPYYRISGNLRLHAVIGAGIAELSYKFSSKAYSDVGFSDISAAFFANFGIGAEIHLTDRISIMPELAYSMILSTLLIPYIGTLSTDPGDLALHNFSMMTGVKYAF